jgi:ABC-type uncharacterized transport system ATPase subunit
LFEQIHHKAKCGAELLPSVKNGTIVGIEGTTGNGELSLANGLDIQKF